MSDVRKMAEMYMQTVNIIKRMKKYDNIDANPLS